jgi:diacylglycerol kinase (ATP)
MLAPDRVIDVTAPGALRDGVLLWMRRRDLDVLVCGGDGTIRWLLETFEDVTGGPGPRPVFGIVPTGVGNDLGKALGWFHLCRRSATRILEELELNGQPHPIDRWTVSMSHAQHGSTTLRPATTMTNYLSIGLDAAGSKGFHRARETAPWLFPAVWVNKLWYGLITGTIAFADKFSSAAPFRDTMVLLVDGRRVDIPRHSAVLAVLNTPTIYGGAKGWGCGCSTSDGILEVVSVRGPVHIAIMLLHLGHAQRLARGAEVTLTCNAGVPMQIDGEPYQIPPHTSIQIRRKGMAYFLGNSTRLVV